MFAPSGVALVYNYVFEGVTVLERGLGTRDGEGITEFSEDELDAQVNLAR